MDALRRIKLPLAEIIVILFVVAAAYPAVLMVVRAEIEREMIEERQYMLEFLAKVAQTKPAAVEKAIESAASNEFSKLD
jgi:DNA-directed RNA polymerase subunit F